MKYFLILDQKQFLLQSDSISHEIFEWVHKIAIFVTQFITPNWNRKLLWSNFSNCYYWESFKSKIFFSNICNDITKVGGVTLSDLTVNQILRLFQNSQETKFLNFLRRLQIESSHACLWLKIQKWTENYVHLFPFIIFRKTIWGIVFSVYLGPEA